MCRHAAVEFPDEEVVQVQHAAQAARLHLQAARRRVPHGRARVHLSPLRPERGVCEGDAWGSVALSL